MLEPVVFAVDDDASLLRSVTRLLRRHGFRVQGFESAAPFLDAIQAGTPGCVLLDLSLPEINGLELLDRLAATGHHQPVIFLTGQGSIQASVRALKSGAMDFLEKPFEADALVAVVQRAIEKDREARARDDENGLVAKRLASLTPRESEVFRHVIAGHLNKQIAARLGTAEKTIKVHRARVMHKMAVRSVAELTRLADFAGIQPAP
jgi:FixJ family two-component response regulator